MSKGSQKTDSNKRSIRIDPPKPANVEEQADEVVDKAASALQRSSSDQPPMPSEVIALQQTAGNRAVQHLLQDWVGQENLKQKSLAVSEKTAPSQMVQRIGVYPFLRPGAAVSPAELGGTPAEQVEALPEEVQRQHQAHVVAGQFQEALNLVVQAMGRSRQINPLLLQTVAHPSRPLTVCQGTDCFVADEGVPGAFTSYCGPIEVGDLNLPNPRVRVNPSVIRSLSSLQSTLLHEFRHIEQEYSEINQAEGAATSGGHRLNCNDPGEMDAYLAEVEHSYEQSEHLLQSFARAYVTNQHLAPEQQTVFRTRLANAHAKVNRLYNTTIEWRTNNHVHDYQAEAEETIAAHEARVQETEPDLTRPFYFNDPMAPLNGDTPTAGTRGGGT